MLKNKQLGPGTTVTTENAILNQAAEFTGFQWNFNVPDTHRILWRLV